MLSHEIIRLNTNIAAEEGVESSEDGNLGIMGGRWL